MKRYHQFNRLVIEDFIASKWEHPLHNHNHFEIIFIREGAGIHHLNNNFLPYKRGHLYVLGPEDEHEFLIDIPTHFIYFKFTKLYLNLFESDNPVLWNKDVDSLLYRTECKRGNLIKNKNDILTVEQILNLIVLEYQKNELLSKKIIFQLFKALVLVLIRNNNINKQKHLKSSNVQSGLAKDLLDYIELHIYDPKKLTKQQIANHFHYSPNYIGSLFKEKVGSTLKKYIQQYRYELLMQRLRHGQLSNKQLVIEFGFTDESHLHKFIAGNSGKKLKDIKQQLHIAKEQ
ncbi:AraC family transcriptional regulator [Zhouia sp. PK063]|uniref:AraC family transcriptional regulator n=1 Tax=Zhouia sp. PK063 TaxID=3373602 RepID=UPI0037978334